jgi:hypothetical protein
MMDLGVPALEKLRSGKVQAVPREKVFENIWKRFEK